jgi:hypothetical protein
MMVSWLAGLVLMTTLSSPIPAPMGLVTMGLLTYSKSQGVAAPAAVNVAPARVNVAPAPKQN